MTERKYKVRFLPFFEMDLIEIVDYISYNLENPYAANLLVEEIEKVLGKDKHVRRVSNHIIQQKTEDIHIIAFMWKTLSFTTL